MRLAAPPATTDSIVAAEAATPKDDPPVQTHYVNGTGISQAGWKVKFAWCSTVNCGAVWLVNVRGHRHD
jgi:hypothetical protein